MRHRPHPSKPRWRWAMVLVLIPILATCGVEDTMPHPDCVVGGPIMHIAQSVPTAQLIPCFDSIPHGWEVDKVTIDQDGTVVRFDSDQAGDGAAVFHYAHVCDLEGAIYAPSEIRGADRYDRVESVKPLRAQRFYEFEGGCMWWEFDFDEGATAGLSVELGQRLSAETRSAVNEAIRESFLDVDL